MVRFLLEYQITMDSSPAIVVLSLFASSVGGYLAVTFLVVVLLVGGTLELHSKINIKHGAVFASFI